MPPFFRSSAGLSCAPLRSAIPQRCLSLSLTHDGEQCCNHFPWPVYADVRDHAKSFSGVAAYYDLVPASISGFGEPERVWGQAATANFFDVAAATHGARPRILFPARTRLPVIVLGYHLWQRRFASDPADPGQNRSSSPGRPFTVIGVAPPAFHGVDSILNPEFWVSLGNVEDLVPNSPNATPAIITGSPSVGRIRPGAIPAQASAELAYDGPPIRDRLSCDRQGQRLLFRSGRYAAAAI